LDIGPLVQVGIVVRDAVAVVEAWRARFKLDDPKYIDWPTTPEMGKTATYHGQPANFRMLLAFLHAGSVQIEFIQPLEGANIYSDFLEEHGEGIHHILFEVDDPVAVANQIGAPILQSGGSSLRPGALWAYLDTQATLKAMVEVKSK
jgi:hypothetical protein